MARDNDEIVSALAREGGYARARKLTPEERKESARKAAKTRWAKYRRDQGLAAVDEIEITHYRLTPKSHPPIAECPCDSCVDFVMARTRQRYLAVLDKIRRMEALTEEEQGFLWTLNANWDNPESRSAPEPNKSSKK